MNYKKGDYALAILRIALGLIFLWTFFDKLFGLGFSTASAKSWINGVSPTSGFLSSAVYGPFALFYKSLAGIAIVDWLFMLGLLVIGLGLTLGIAIRLSSLSGIILLLLMFTSMLPPKNHPFLDEHIIYALALIVITLSNAGSCLGLGNWWSNLKLIKKLSWLK